MKYIWEDRRLFVATICLIVLGYMAIKGDGEVLKIVAGALATISVGVCGANAAESAFAKKYEKK